VSSRKRSNSKQSRNNNNNKIENDPNKIQEEKKNNTRSYKAYKSDNKYKRKESHFTTVQTIQESIPLDEEKFQEEISKQYVNHFLSNDLSIEEIETNEKTELKISHLLTEEEQGIDQEIVKKQEEIKQLQKNAPPL